MLAAVVLASFWAQAEAAPLPPPPEPLPPPEPPPPTLANSMAVIGQFAYRLGAPADALGPKAGFSLGGTYERRYLTLGPGVELAGTVDFFYDRFATGVTGSTMVEPGVEQTFAGTRAITETSFALLQKVAWRVGRVRPFAAGGVGLAIDYFSSPELALRPGSMTGVQALVRGALGVDIALSATSALVVRGDYTHAFGRPTFTTDTGTTLSLFGDILDAGVGILFRF
jgi:hypothetical protein